MELVFALVTYLGMNKIDETYFRNIDDCIYFQERLNKQPRVPKRDPEGNDVPGAKFVVVCKPLKVNLNKTKVY